MQNTELKKLLESLSLEEKICQLLQVCGYYYEMEGVVTGPQNTAGFNEKEIANAGSVLGIAGAKRLKEIQKKYMAAQQHHIPLLFMADVINGYKTIFPIPLAQGCSFNPDMVKKAAGISAKESAAAGLHLTFSPMVDVVRDPRWGRVMESTGEDTYVNCVFAKAMVEGYQGTNGLNKKGKIAACVKHFAGYGAPMAGRDYNTVELSERTLRENYLPPYRAAIESGCSTAMTSFNTLDRIPSTANKKLMRDILRSEMGFDGVLISDWAAIEELINHGVAKAQIDAAKLAIEAGVDIDMMTTCYCRNLKKLIEDKIIDKALLDEAVFRVLQLKNSLGLFENPFKDADEEDEMAFVLCDEHRKFARKLASETMVLLKNEEILPLPKKGKKIAFIGPHTSHRWILGAWSIFGEEKDAVSLEQAIKEMEIENASFAAGCPILTSTENLEMAESSRTAIAEDNKNAKALLDEALLKAKEADIVVLSLGEHPSQSGEASSRVDLQLDAQQIELFNQIYNVNQNIAVVLFNGRPLILGEIFDKAKAVLEAWLPGTEGGNAVADILFGNENPSGKLTMSFPRHIGQIPIYYNEFKTGRPYHGDGGKYFSKYIDCPNSPLLPFGYGLSYTSFEISEVSLSRNSMTCQESIFASVRVKNTGKIAGKEVIQCYISDKVGSVARPVRELKAFQKIKLQPGEEKEVVFEITEKMLRFYTIDMEYKSEPGEFDVWIGNSSLTQNGQTFNLV